MGTTQSNNLAQTPDGIPVVDVKTGKINYNWNQWFTNVQIKLNTITAAIIALSKNATAGFLSSDGAGGIFSRTLTAGTGITITNPTGTGGNPVISASASGGGPIDIVNNTAATHIVNVTDLPSLSSNAGWIASNYASTNYIQIDTHANQAIPIGAHLYVSEEGTGTTNIQALTGVTFVGPTITAVAKGVGEVVQISTDVWHVFGNLAYSIPTYASTILADGPVAFWELAETSGTVAADATGHGYNGTYTGTYTLGATSLLPNGQGKSLSVAGSGYVALPNVAAINAIVSPLTLEYWFSMPTIPTTSGPQFFVCLGSNASPSLGISVNVNGEITFQLMNVSNPSIMSQVLVASTVYYVVLVVSGTTVSWYLNGTLINTGSASVSAGSGAGAIAADAAHLGSYNLTGNIQNVAVYNKALTSTQITAHYAAG